MNTGKSSGNKASSKAGQKAGGNAGKTVTVQQTGSPMRRPHTQRETLVGLKLNKIGRVAELLDTPQTRGMIAKVAHLVKVVEK